MSGFSPRGKLRFLFYKNQSFPPLGDFTESENLITSVACNLGNLAEKFRKQGKVSFLENASLRGFLTHLKLKKLFSLNDKKIRNFPILHQNTFKPLHLEISYKNLVIIYLYSPQKIALPCSIDMGLIVRSLA